MTDKHGFYIEGPGLVRLYEPGRIVTFDHGNISIEHIGHPDSASLNGDSSGYPRTDEALEARE